MLLSILKNVGNDQSPDFWQNAPSRSRLCRLCAQRSEFRKIWRWSSLNDWRNLKNVKEFLLSAKGDWKVYFASWIILYLQRFFKGPFPIKSIEVEWQRGQTLKEKSPLNKYFCFFLHLDLCIVRILQPTAIHYNTSFVVEPTKQRGNFAVSVPILTFTSFHKCIFFVSLLWKNEARSSLSCRIKL